ncbi:MAG: hypothetical protein IJY96_01040 [Oscillospiraceae bacterium]|nr:hypothetical protein [Oscillospiraceae bacterium]
MKGYLCRLNTYIRENKAVFSVYVVLRLIVLACMVLSAVDGNWENVFVCILVLVLFLVPSFLSEKLKIEFPSALQIIILLFIFAAEILGELGNYYIQYRHWDTLLHITWGFLCAAIGFSLVDILNRDSRVKMQLSPLYLALAAFCFSMTIGVFWEFFEFFADTVLGLDMQKDTVIHSFRSVMLDETMSNIPILVEGITDTAVNGQSLGLGGYLDIGLYDTMEDLFINFIGAALFSLVGFIDARRGEKSRLTAALVPRLRKKQ